MALHRRIWMLAPAVLGALFALACGANPVVAKYSGGEVTRRELNQFLQSPQGQSEEGKKKGSPEDLAEAAKQAAVQEYLEMKGRALRNSPEAKIHLEVAAMEAAVTAWVKELEKQVRAGIDPEKIKAYLKRHGNSIRRPGEVAYYFLYIKTQGLTGDALADAKARAAEYARKGQSDPTQFETLAKVHSEVEDPRFANRLGMVSREDLPGYLGDILFDRLQINQVSDPIEVPDGIGIFQVSIRKEGTPPAESEVEDIARQRILTQEMKDRIPEEMDKLHAKFGVENFWLDKEYDQWKDEDIVYRAGPLQRTFAQLKQWAPFKNTIMCAANSGEVVESSIRRDLAGLEVTKGSGKVEPLLTAQERMKALQRAVLLEEILQSKEMIDAGIENLRQQVGLTAEPKPASLEEFGKMIYTRYAGMLDLGSCPWMELETVMLAPDPEVLAREGSIPVRRGLEVGAALVEALRGGADPQKAQQLLPPGSPFSASYTPLRKVPESSIAEVAIRMLSRTSDDVWCDPVGYAGKIFTHRVSHRRSSSVIPYEAAKAEFLQGFRKYLALQQEDQLVETLKAGVEVVMENLPRH